MKPRHIALAILLLMGGLAVINAVLGNIVANLLQDKLGDYAWVIVVPFVVIAALLLGFELRDRLQEPHNDRPPAFDRRNRQAMLEKVRTYWIAGILQHSLVHEVLIALDVAARPEAVMRPLDLLVQRPDHGDRPLPPGTRLIDVFDDVGQALLILGAPGAGKTTLLLELAQDLLGRAAQDPEAPMPVVFPLSSWTQQRRAMTDWLVDALQDQYDIPRTIGHAWVASNQILPLLDGLDEVASEHRAACVEVINTFRQDHGLLPLAVCSRVADYEAMGPRLRLHGAIIVQPLTPKQVETYVAQIGPSAAAVHDALREDPTLWELLETPLMLFVMTLTYAGQPVVALRTSGTLQERRRDLFEHYVDRMFQRRGASPPYPHQQTERWLTWLAWQMGQHDLSTFHLEQIQPDWLPQQRKALGIGIGLVGGLGGGLGGGLVHGLFFGLAGVLGFGLGFGLLFGGLACLQHFGLRLFLVRRGWAPWPYVKFLNYAAEILFLRQIGGGYIFIHRLLQDHFAALYKE